MMIDPDRVIQDALSSQALPAYNWFFATITWLGSARLWLLILAGCIVVTRWRKIAAVLLIVVAFSMVINEDVKEIVRRVRPGDVVVGGYFVAQSYSFPSGHTQTAFVIATVLSAFLDRRYNAITFLLAAAVGMSRMYLGVHFFTDVVAGAAAGIVLGVLAVCCLEKLGVYGGDGLFRTAPRPKESVPGREQENAEVVKYAAVTLAAGFIIGYVTFYLSRFLLSLAAIGITYIILLLLPTMLEVRSRSKPGS